MTENITSREQFFNLLESATETRNKDILAPVLADVESDRQLDAAHNWKSLVVGEAIRLAARVDFLARHPRLPVFLGGCATKVLRPIWPERFPGVNYLSESILSTEPEYLGDHSVRNSFQFGTSHYNATDPSYLKIFGVTEELNSGEQTREELYCITASPRQHINFWQVEGPQFRKYRTQKYHEIGEEYKKENPWLSNYYIHQSGRWRVTRNHQSEKGEDDFAELTELAQEKKIQRELIPRLEEGPNTWQYPDELYYFPLGLLIQANEVFGTKQR